MVVEAVGAAVEGVVGRTAVEVAVGEAVEVAVGRIDSVSMILITTPINMKVRTRYKS